MSHAARHAAHALLRRQLEHDARDAIERLVGARHRLDARERRGAADDEHRLAELQPERHLRDRAVAAADGDEHQGGAGDQRVPRHADAGRDRDRHPRVRGAPVAVGQHADDGAAGFGRTLRHRGHHADQTAAEHDEAHLSEAASERASVGELRFARLARADHADRRTAGAAALALEPAHRVAEGDRRPGRGVRAPYPSLGVEPAEARVAENAAVTIEKQSGTHRGRPDSTPKASRPASFMRPS